MDVKNETNTPSGEEIKEEVKKAESVVEEESKTAAATSESETALSAQVSDNPI